MKRIFALILLAPWLCLAQSWPIPYGSGFTQYVGTIPLEVQGNIEAQKSGANAFVRAHNSTATDSNYERISLGSFGSSLGLSVEKGGSGSYRNMIFLTGGSDRWIIDATTGDLWPGLNTTYAIGTSGNRVTNVYTLYDNYDAAGGPDWNGRGKLRFTADGAAYLSKNIGSGSGNWSRLGFGGYSSNNPALWLDSTGTNLSLAIYTDSSVPAGLTLGTTRILGSARVSGTHTVDNQLVVMDGGNTTMFDASAEGVVAWTNLSSTVAFRTYGTNFFGGTNRFNTVYEDLRTDGTAIRTVGANQMSWGTFGTNSDLQGYYFPDAQTTEFWANFQLPHGWKYGTDANIHLHFSPSTTPSGSATNVIFQLTYIWKEINGTNTATTTVNVTNSISGAVAWQHKLVSLATASGTGKTLSSVVRCNVKRIGGTDSYDGSIFVQAFDAHIQMDSLGSEGEVLKY